MIGSLSRFCGVSVAVVLTAAALVLSAKPLFAEETGFPKSHQVVAIGGSVTEIVYALGEEERLIARDTTSIYPAEASNLPDVGYMRALSPEGVLSVNPDLILMLEGSGPQETLDVLHKSGVTMADVPEAYTAEGILRKVRVVGEVLGVPVKAEALAGKLGDDLAEAQRAAESRTEGVRVLFVLSTKAGRILAAGSDTAANGILTLAGAENATTGFSGYKILSDEAIISAAPDVVLMMDRHGDGDSGASAEAIFDHPALAQTPAGRNKRLIRMNGQLLLGFGPRTAEAVRDLSNRLADTAS
ncbi:ABC transporter substrate-binding protein [Stappia sp. BW2]|uniref:heme/hemin ABC transporter substrate-binding protein n=1 Tax=Stappia sp. BW2 TaxID=2592622 RepID=UPI0013C2B7B5|nr:ABC transporter substrate-binding protein [Stappia sp. BW2]